MRKFWKEESGQDLVEYALVVGILALGTVTAMTTAGTTIKDMWGTLNTKLTGANTEMAK